MSDNRDDLTTNTTPDKSYLLGSVGEIIDAEAEEGLSEFLRKVLPHLSQDQLFRLVCAIPEEAWPKEELYDGESALDTTLEGQVRRMQTAVRAMYNKVFLNGRIRDGIDVAEAQKVFNACRDSLKNLVGIEQELYTLERMQAVETATVKILKSQFPEMVDPFLEALEKELSRSRV